MSDKDDLLQKALAENTQFKIEKADNLRRESTAQFRIHWLPCDGLGQTVPDGA